MIDIKAMQQKYGKPTVSDAVNAYYILAALYEMAEKVEFMHNFQLERAEYDERKAIYDREQRVNVAIYTSRNEKVYKALKERRNKKI